MIILKNKKKNFLLSFFLFLFLSFILVKKLCYGIDRQALLVNLRRADKNYLYFAFFLALFSIFGEALNLKRLLGLLSYPTKLSKTFKYALTGFFFSSITPSATGGQPVQVYQMKKDGIKVGDSTSILLIQLLSYQLATILIGLISIILNFSTIDSKIIRLLILSGLIINLLGFTLVYLAVFKQGIVERLLKVLDGFLGLFLENKKRERFIEKLEESIEDYRKTGEFFKDKKLDLFKILIVSMGQIISLFSISYFIYLALGARSNSYLDLLSLQSLVYLASSLIPIPGGLGIRERNFSVLYKRVYTRELLEASLVLTRFIDFYLLLILTFLLLIFYKIYEKINP